MRSAVLLAPRSFTRRTWLAIAAVVLLIGATISTYVWWNGPRLTWPGEPGSSTADFSAVAAKNAPVVWGTIILCATGGTVTVTDITAHDTTPGFSLTGWGHRRDPNQYGAYRILDFPGTLTHFGFETSPVKIRTKCSSLATTEPHIDLSIVELAVQGKISTDVSGWASALDVHYKSRGRSRVLTIPMLVGRCGKEGSPYPTRNDPCDYPRSGSSSSPP